MANRTVDRSPSSVDVRSVLSRANCRAVWARCRGAALALGACSMLAGIAGAQTQTYMVNVQRSPTGTEQVVHVPGYTGTAPLTSVTVTLHVCTVRQYGVENLHPTLSTLGGEFFADESIFAVSRSPGATDILAMTTASFPDTVIFPGHPFDGAIDFAGTSGMKAPTIQRIVTAVQVSNTPESAFHGDSIPLYVDSQSPSPFQTLGGANVAALHISLYSAMITVQYN